MIDIVKYFTKEEEIAGLSVSEKSLRLVLLGKDEKQHKKVAVKALADETLPEGTIVNGEIKNVDEMKAALERLKDKLPYKITYVVLTLPQYLTYSKIFYFPKAITGERLEETMRVMVSVNLPVKVDEVYLDWEKLDTERNELYLEAIPREIVDFYIKVLGAADIRVVAIESYYPSAVRALDLTTPLPILLIKEEESRTSFVIIKDRIVRFTRTIPKKLDSKELEMETKRISDFYEAEDMPIAEIGRRDEVRIAPKFYEHPELRKGSYLWLPSFGAAMRGLLPRSEDKLVSLMPTGTEKAYENQKMLVFTKFTADIITGISIFFTIAFLGALALSNVLASNINLQLAELISPTPPADAIAIEERAKKFNNFSEAIAEIDKTSPRWSRVITEVRTRTTEGISLSNINMSANSGRITINGVSKGREQINVFENSIKDSEMFTDVKFPPRDLGAREDIPFSATMNLRNTASLYAN